MVAAITPYYHSQTTYMGHLGHGWYSILGVRLLKWEDGTFSLRDPWGRREDFSAAGINQTHSFYPGDLVLGADSVFFRVDAKLTFVFHRNDGTLARVKNDAGASYALQYDESAAPLSEAVAGTARRKYAIRGISQYAIPAGYRATIAMDFRATRLIDGDDASRWIALEYDTTGMVRRAYDHIGREVRYEYDAAGNLVRVRFADGTLRRYRFEDGQQVHLMTRLDARPIRPALEGDESILTTNKWDRIGRVVEQTHIGASYSFTRTPYSRSASVVNSGGQSDSVITFVRRTTVERTEPDGLGGTRHTTKVFEDAVVNRQPLGADLKPTGDAAFDSRVETITETVDGVALVRTITYDASNRVIARKRPDGTVVTYKRQGPQGQVTLVVETPPASLKVAPRYTRFAYDALGHVVAEVDSLDDAHWTRKDTKYDAAGRIESETMVGPEGTGRTVTRTYDASGRLLSQSSQPGETVAWWYATATSKLADSVTFGDGAGERYVRDALGHITSRRDHLGGVRTTAYDALGRETLACNELGVCTRSIYDGPDLVAIEEGVRVVGGQYTMPQRQRRFEVDAYGRRVKEFLVTPAREVLKRKTVYDAFGSVVEEWDNPDSTNTDSTKWRLIVRNKYDGRSHLLERRTFPQGPNKDSLVTKYAYDALGRVTRETDPRGSTTTRTLDPWANVLVETDAINRSVHRGYDHRNLVLADTNALGKVTNFEYDALGHEVRRVGWHGEETIRRYAGDRLMQERSAEGRWTSYGYDLRGRLVRTIRKVGDDALLADGDDIVQETAFDALGRRSRELVAGRVVHRYGYDAAGHLEVDTNALGQITTYVYDDLGRQTEVRLPSADTLLTVYDAQGRTGSRVLRSAQGEVDTLAVTRYDAADRTVVERTPGRGSISMTYDGTDYVTETRDSAGMITTFIQDRMGRDSLITAAGATRKTVRDKVGRVTEQWDERGNVVKLGYDALDRLTSLMDNEGHKTNFEYTDSLGGWRKHTIYPGGKSEDEIHDRDNLLRIFIDGRQVYRSNTYDSLGRLVKIVLAKQGEANEEFKYTWDAWDNLVQSEKSGEVVLDEQFDALGRLEHSTQVIAGTRYEVASRWDDATRKRALTLPDGSLRVQSWSARGLIDSVWLGDRLLASMKYEHGLEKRRALRNGLLATFEPDAAGRPHRQVYSSLSEGSVDMEITYDAAGNRALIRRSQAPDRSEKMGYTKDHQLGSWAQGVADASGAISSPASQQIWNLDSRGNWTSWTRGASAQTRIPNGANELTQVGSEMPIWDMAGNLTGLGGRTFSWDRRGMLSQIAEGAQSLADYGYDPLGRRIMKVVGSLHTDVVYDGWQPVYSVTRGGEADTAKIWAYGNYVDEPVALICKWGSSSDTAYFLQGNNYNVEALTDRTGAIVERYEYAPYGEPTIYTGKGADGKWYTGDDVTATRSSRGNDVLFQGRQIDWESGLYYYRARMYSPSLGRFISRDPLRFAAGDENLFRFLRNSPASLLDPFGTTSVPGPVFSTTGCTRNVSLALRVQFTPDEKWPGGMRSYWSSQVKQIGEGYFNSLPMKCKCDKCSKCPDGISVRLSISVSEYSGKKCPEGYWCGSVGTQNSGSFVNYGAGLVLDYFDIFSQAKGRNNVHRPILHEILHMLGLSYERYGNKGSSASLNDDGSLLGLGERMREDDFNQAFCDNPFAQSGNCTDEK